MLNLNSVGFRVENLDDFHALTQTILKRGKAHRAFGTATYVLFKEKGLELWLKIGADGTITGINTFFNSGTSIPVAVVDQVQDPEDPLDGALVAWARPALQHDPESGIFPFVFDLPDSYRHNGLQLPAFLDLRWCAFARKVELIRQNKLDSVPEVAWKFFTPTGLFTGDQIREIPVSEAVMSGIVASSNFIQNPISGNTFNHIVLDTYGGQIDVLYFPDLIPEPPQKGDLLRGTFDICGKTDAFSEEKMRRGFIERLFWGA